MEATVATPVEETAAPRVRLRRPGVTLAVVVLVAMVTAAVVAGPRSGSWTSAQRLDEIGGNSPEVNTPFLDRCATESSDGLTLYVASSRPRFPGDRRTDVDIWAAHRPSRHAPWSRPENLPPPLNSPADDFCPTPAGDGALYFASTRTVPGETCGLGDLYVVRRDTVDGALDVEHLPCAPNGPNTSGDEHGPSYANDRLYFSRSSAATPGDLYESERRPDGSFGPAVALSTVNSPADDRHPTVRRDGRELIFASSRSGGAGGHDVWVATRPGAEHDWSAPVNLGAGVNTRVGETHPAVSRNGETLYVGRAPGVEGAMDVYAALRRARPRAR